MVSHTNNEYFPSSISHPGETLIETLATIGMSQAELARRTGRPTKTINEIIRGKAAITPETSLQLERVLGIPASFWNNRERQYRASLAREEERSRLLDQIQWLNLFPVKKMIAYGWIDHFDHDVDQLQEVLNFFGIASPMQWDQVVANEIIGYRKSSTYKSNIHALAAWLRKGEMEGKKIHCGPFNYDAFYRSLYSARKLTNRSAETIQSELTSICANAGVAITFIRELPNTYISGATRWLTPEKALINLSLRYKSDDHLWFSFFHEAGHIVLRHAKREIHVNEENDHGSKEEMGANRFSNDFLIPLDKLNRFILQMKNSHYSTAKIKQFAEELGIAPGIVVGRLQHEKELPFSHLNGLKRRYTWSP
jgi:addiction module HigA family antidote